MKPRIIIVGGPALDRQFMEESWVLNKIYTAAFSAGGGIPYFATESVLADEYADFGDELVLTGTQWFSPDGKGLDVLKDRETEMVELYRLFFEAFLKAGKPVVGICQGFQLINMFLGGTVIKDFKFERGTEHFSTSHSITVTEDSVLYRLFGKKFIVNSRHNMCLGEVSPQLRITGVSPDGIAEAFEGVDAPIYGFQFHPERMRGDFPEPYNGIDGGRLIRYLVSTAEHS